MTQDAGVLEERLVEPDGSVDAERRGATVPATYPSASTLGKPHIPHSTSGTATAVSRGCASG